MKPGRPYRVTATGTAFDAGNGSGQTMIGARLQAGGGAAATAVVRETDGSGTVLAELGAAQGLTDESAIPVTFSRKVHVTLTGAGASCVVYVG